uniref:Uncharacterized protein n=1 Tax=Triticum urartu TaxID=4572 RepID=A0A8R7PMG6_TRIUA
MYFRNPVHGDALVNEFWLYQTARCVCIFTPGDSCASAWYRRRQAVAKAISTRVLSTNLCKGDVHNTILEYLVAWYVRKRWWAFSSARFICYRYLDIFLSLGYVMYIMGSP